MYVCVRVDCMWCVCDVSICLYMCECVRHECVGCVCVCVLLVLGLLSPGSQPSQSRTRFYSGSELLHPGDVEDTTDQHWLGSDPGQESGL